MPKNVQLGKGLIFTLPGVFTGNPKRLFVNGSIWTLPAEVCLCLWAALAGVTGILVPALVPQPLLAALFVCGLLVPAHVPLAWFLRLAGCFALGVFCCVNRERV